jgi:hypothetical protein
MCQIAEGYPIGAQTEITIMDRQNTELDLLTRKLTLDELDLVAGGRIAIDLVRPDNPQPGSPGTVPPVIDGVVYSLW